jgi:hypothetical protein
MADGGRGAVTAEGVIARPVGAANPAAAACASEEAARAFWRAIAAGGPLAIGAGRPLADAGRCGSAADGAGSRRGAGPRSIAGSCALWAPPCPPPPPRACAVALKPATSKPAAIVVSQIRRWMIMGEHPFPNGSAHSNNAPAHKSPAFTCMRGLAVGATISLRYPRTGAMASLLRLLRWARPAVVARDLFPIKQTARPGSRG